MAKIGEEGVGEGWWKENPMMHGQYLSQVDKRNMYGWQLQVAQQVRAQRLPFRTV